ncbi:hypothetical protein LSTR_LSTR016141, partial [Laodelphax striatellus]
CESLLEDYESTIETWYFQYQDKVTLKQYLCSERALKGSDDSCLTELTPNLKGETGDSSKQKDEL